MDDMARLVFCDEKCQLEHYRKTSPREEFGKLVQVAIQATACAHCAWCGVKVYDGEPQCTWHALHQEECPDYLWEGRWLARAFVEYYISRVGEPPSEDEFEMAGRLAKKGDGIPWTHRSLLRAILGMRGLNS